MAGERGCTWDLFEQNARDNEIESSCMSSRHPISPTTGRLCREDMGIYGEVPISDCLSLVVCQQCHRVFKSEAVTKHRECYHSELMPSSVLCSLPTLLPSPHSIGQSSRAFSTNLSSAAPTGHTHHSQSVEGKEEEEDTFGFTASALPTIATALPAAAAPMTRNNSRDYDPDKHCSVWMEAERRYCTHSLTCKVHSVSERREVKGRSSKFDELLEEHRKRKKMKKHRLRAEVGTSQISSGHDGGHMSPISPSSPLFFGGASSSGRDFGSSNNSSGGERRGSLSSHQIHHSQSPQSTDTPTTPDPHWGYDDYLNTFPQPLATCSLSCRSSRGTLVFGRKGDNLRTLLARLSGREGEYSTITPHRKHAYNALLESQKNRKRKYFSHREQVSHLHSTIPPDSDEAVSLRSYTLPLPLSLVPAQPLPQTPSTPLPHTPSTPLPHTPSHSLPCSPSQPSNSRHFTFSSSFSSFPTDSFIAGNVSDSFINNKITKTTKLTVLPTVNSAVDDNVSGMVTSISQLSSLDHQQADATHTRGDAIDSSGVPVSQVVGATGDLFVPGKFYSNSAHDPMSLLNTVTTQPQQTPRHLEQQQLQQQQQQHLRQQQLQQQQQQQQLQQQQQQLQQQLQKQQHAQFVGTLVSHGTTAAIAIGSELPTSRSLTLEEWGSGRTGPRMRQRRRGTLGINGESAGIDPDLIGVARQSGVFSEEGGERVVVGAKRKKVPGKKSKSKRQHTDPHHGLHPRHSITEDSINSFEVSPAPVSSSSLWDVPHTNPVGVPGLMHAAVIQPTTIPSEVENARVGSLASIRRPPSGEVGSIVSQHVSAASSFQTGNGVSATSNSDSLVPGGSGLSYSQNVYVSESVRARTGLSNQVDMSTPTSQIATLGVHVATSISQLEDTSLASSRESHRLAPEFGHIRVKLEPGLSDRDTHKSSLNKSLPNGLISSQCSTPQLTAASPVATAGSLGGETSGTGSVIPPLSRPHSFNTLSLGHTLVSPHSLSPLNQQQHVGNLIGLRHLYTNPQQLLAAAAAAAQSPTQSMQQLASYQQLQNAALYKQMLQQQQQQARLLQPTATTAKTPPVIGGGGGGVRNYQQVSSGTAGCLPRLQMAGAKQHLSTPINAHHRQNMPTLTPGKVRAPISTVPSGVVGFNGPEGHRTMPTLTPGGISRTQNSLPPPLGPYRQNKSSAANPASDRPHPPSQQVT